MTEPNEDSCFVQLMRVSRETVQGSAWTLSEEEAIWVRENLIKNLGDPDVDRIVDRAAIDQVQSEVLDRTVSTYRPDVDKSLWESE